MFSLICKKDTKGSGREKNGYNGDLTSREAGSVGGQMVKKMIEAYEQGMQ